MSSYIVENARKTVLKTDDYAFAIAWFVEAVKEAIEDDFESPEVLHLVQEKVVGSPILDFRGNVLREFLRIGLSFRLLQLKGILIDEA